jgi:hypothetical protein
LEIYLIRQHRSRRVVSALAVVLAGAAVTACGGSGMAAQARTCERHVLPIPDDGMAATVYGATPDGLTLVGSVEPSADAPAVVWRDGGIARVIEAPGPLLDMNTAETGVGTAGSEVDDGSWVYEAGEVRRLPGHGQATAIGVSGQIVGSRWAETSGGPPIAVPAYWPSSRQELVDLPMASEESGEGTDVAADGTIVGAVGSEAYVWLPDGTHGPLPRPEGVPSSEPASAERISGSWVIGESGGPVRWNLPTGAVERMDIDGHRVRLPLPDGPGNLPPFFVDLTSISADGTVVGGTTSERASLSEQPMWWRCT